MIESIFCPPIFTLIITASFINFSAGKDENYQAIIGAIKMDTTYEELDRDHPGKDFGKLAWDKLAILDDQPNTLIIYDSIR